MNRKHLILIMTALAICTLFALCGCGGSSEEATEETTTAAATERMSTDQLTDIALQDIGLSAGNVSDISYKEDGDNAIIKFKAEGKDCSYTINAFTGEIVDKSVPEGIGEANESSDPAFDAVLDKAYEEIEGFDGQITNLKEKAADGVTTITFDWNGNNYEYKYDQEKKMLVD